MKKKEYIQPQTEMIALQAKNCILAGSTIFGGKTSELDGDDIIND